MPLVVTSYNGDIPPASRAVEYLRKDLVACRMLADKVKEDPLYFTDVLERTELATRAQSTDLVNNSNKNQRFPWEFSEIITFAIKFFNHRRLIPLAERLTRMILREGEYRLDHTPLALRFLAEDKEACSLLAFETRTTTSKIQDVLLKVADDVESIPNSSWV